ncbi:M20/M25/M40 family metallo-hydrolase [Agromyces hippuratus]|uniref:M20/M25/M40 family metallo-hydrolase n=1 Tax=Agromyces hippuratus TaxID=286438 RepID=UPI0035F04435
MAHFDVVPVDERDGWRFPPFEGRIADGSVWGRGTSTTRSAARGARGGREPPRRRIHARP